MMRLICGAPDAGAAAVADAGVAAGAAGAGAASAGAARAVAVEAASTALPACRRCRRVSPFNSPRFTVRSLKEFQRPGLYHPGHILHRRNPLDGPDIWGSAGGVVDGPRPANGCVYCRCFVDRAVLNPAPIRPVAADGFPASVGAHHALNGPLRRPPPLQGGEGAP